MLRPLPLALDARRLLPALLVGLTLTAAGCVGSSAPYRPGYQPRPTQEPVMDEVERVRREAVPVEVARSDAYIKAGRKEVARIMGSSAANPWNSYRDDMNATLGTHADAYMAAAVGDDAGASREEESGGSDDDQDGGGDEWGDEPADDGGDDDEWGW